MSARERQHKRKMRAAEREIDRLRGIDRAYAIVRKDVDDAMCDSLLAERLREAHHKLKRELGDASIAYLKLAGIQPSELVDRSLSRPLSRRAKES